MGFVDGSAPPDFPSPSTFETGHRHQPRSVVQQGVQLFQLERAVFIQGDHPQLRPHTLTEHCPGHDVGMVLHWVMMMLSPACFALPQLLATRFIPSVVPRTNTSSSGERALRKAATACARFPCAGSPSALRVWIPAIVPPHNRGGKTRLPHPPPDLVFAHWPHRMG